MKIKYFIKSFHYLRIFFSPFKRPKINFYIGKIAIGTPYFYPRKWVKLSKREVIIKAFERYTSSLSTDKTLAYWIRNYTDTQKAIPKKIGFDFVSLGWKTKWTSTDYRFEWSPMISFVFFKWQFVVFFIPEHQEHAWTSWLYYERDTDKTKSAEERVKQCREGFPQIWTLYKKDGKETIDYYQYILKKKYL